MAPLLVERSGRVLLLTLNRPEVRNAIDKDTAEAIAAAIDEFEGDPGLSVGVIAGSENGFCAGMDLKAFAATGERPWAGGRGFAGIVRRPPTKPMIAAIERFAVAGGLEIALACDLIVAAKGTRLGIPEVKRGLVAAAGALRRLPRRVPHGVALELALTGEPIVAERAFELGLVNRLVDPGEALQAALELAAAIAANGPLALSATKRVLDQQDAWTEAEFWARQDEITAPVFDSDDAQEGARAFAERREPSWTGQ